MANGREVTNSDLGKFLGVEFIVLLFGGALTAGGIMYKVSAQESSIEKNYSKIGEIERAYHATDKKVGELTIEVKHNTKAVEQAVENQQEIKHLLNEMLLNQATFQRELEERTR